MDRDVDGAARDVQAAINAARGSLPTTLTQTPTYRKMNTGDVYLQGVYQHVSGTGDSGIHAVINGLSASESASRRYGGYARPVLIADTRGAGDGFTGIYREHLHDGIAAG
ncbi:hypothetical protein ACTJLC_26825 [Paraburkholderia sp. 22099]|jgi:hypothetical protein|uniref:hypothetical protein n=1 Tax=Paraburkholderia TaxID=1822464 RepID=UPI00285EEB2C|nr:hypothetical protein [Paraburkholderia terricola]